MRALYFLHNNTTEVIIQGTEPVKGYSVHLFQTALLKKKKTSENWSNVLKAFKHSLHSVVSLKKKKPF